MSVKSMCLNFNFCLYYSSVMDFKPHISSSLCGKLSIFKPPRLYREIGPNEILNSISYSEDPFKQTEHPFKQTEHPFKQTEHCTELNQTLFNTIKLGTLYRPDYSCLQLLCCVLFTFHHIRESTI